MSEKRVERGGCPRHHLKDVRVIQRHSSISAFNGYRPQSSDYSTVMCFVKECRPAWIARTKASYVEKLKDATDADMGIRGEDANKMTLALNQ